MSAAGGVDKAVQRGREVGCSCIQLFTHNNSRWSAPALTGEDVAAFLAARHEHGISLVIAHSSYLINLATPDPELWKKSILGLVMELTRAEQLAIPHVVVHPGAATSSSEGQGLRRVIRALNEVHRRTRGVAAECLLENTAGQGSSLGWRFEHLAVLLDGVREPERLGFCFDTCHAHAAGYPLVEKSSYLQTMGELNRLVGFARLKAIHLNDSKRALGSRVDRHEHIGRGCLGWRPFGHILNDRRLRMVPMYLETPKGEDPRTGRDWDVVNLRRLRHLIGRAGK